MRQVIVVAYVTMDGIMQAPGGRQEDPTGDFDQGGWSVGYWDDVMNNALLVLFDEPFDLLLGRRTYEIFAAHWPYVNANERSERGGTASRVDDPVAATFNSARKYVASRKGVELRWQNSVLLEGDAADAVGTLKAQDGRLLLVHGSSELVQTLLRHQLVDELRVWTFPVVVGRGKRLFGDGAVPSGFELKEVATSTTGVIMATYRPAGAIRAGDFTFDEPTDEELERRRRLALEDQRLSDDLFAGIHVSNYAVARAWYTRLFGADPSFIAHETEAVWELAEHRWIVIEQDAEHPERVGHADHTIFVDDLDNLVAQIAARGVEPAKEETYPGGVRKAIYRDPDGNEIGFGGART